MDLRLTQQIQGQIPEATVEAQASAGTGPVSAELLGPAALVEAGGWLVAVLALIVLLGWLARRLRINPPGSPLLSVESSLSIGARERLLVVRAGDKRLLLASSAAGLSFVHRLDAEGGRMDEDLAEAEALSGASGESPERLNRRLHALLGKAA